MNFLKNLLSNTFYWGQNTPCLALLMPLLLFNQSFFSFFWSFSKRNIISEMVHRRLRDTLRWCPHFDLPDLPITTWEARHEWPLSIHSLVPDFVLAIQCHLVGGCSVFCATCALTEGWGDICSSVSRMNLQVTAPASTGSWVDLWQWILLVEVVCCFWVKHITGQSRNGDEGSVDMGRVMR